MEASKESTEDKELISTSSLLGKIWTGNVTKKTYLKYFLIVMIIYFTGIIGAAAVYPGGFTLENVYVSYLGGTFNNPDGYIFYNTCVIITGFLLIPHFIYFYKHLQPHPKILNQLVCFFGIIGGLGFVVVGIYHQGTDADGHSIATLIAFAGYGASALFLLFDFIVKIIKKENWPKLKHIFFVYVPLLGLLTIILLFTEYEELFTGFNIDERYFNDRFWEWFYLLVVVIWLWEIIIITPNEPIEIKNKI
jgi:hypothetical protein